MLCLGSSTCFHVGILYATIFVQKAFDAHPLALVITVWLGGVGGDTKQLELKVLLV